MHHGLLLTWAQALSQAAFLTSGAMKGKIVTKGNISAEEGDSVILQCHLSSTTAKVTQINWELQDQLLASYHTDFGWYIDPGFRERVAPGPSLGLTFQSLTTNDSGEYFCIYHTYPDGIYKGRISLEVLGRSVAEHSTWIPIPLLGAVAIVLGVICITVIGVVVFTRKKTTLTIHSGESGLRRTPAEVQDWSSGIPSSPGSCVQVEAAPAGLCGEERGAECAEPPYYFNVLSYRSLGSFSFPTEPS
ncbi:T-cell immunoreceptor with Ig and ITIM domains isoform X2 [Castor canadensis]|uniref:T-cell immunoreceptor with Ig and ITIM domains isoform X2 n=1 Tax=Castor canadensis TaxID=51338 RepID=UPI003D1679D1